MELNQIAFSHRQNKRERLGQTAFLTPSKGYTSFANSQHRFATNILRNTPMLPVSFHRTSDNYLETGFAFSRYSFATGLKQLSRLPQKTGSFDANRRAPGQRLSVYMNFGGSHRCYFGAGANCRVCKFRWIASHDVLVRIARNDLGSHLSIRGCNGRAASSSGGSTCGNPLREIVFILSSSVLHRFSSRAR